MSEKEDALEQIEGYRKTIDDLDAKIVGLLNARADQSLAIRALKPAAGMQSVYDPDREERIMQRLEGLSDGPMRAQDVREVYAAILKVMKDIPTPGDAPAPADAPRAEGEPRA